MSFVNFDGSVKKVNHKPKGVTELVLEISTKDLGNSIQNLAEMIDNDVRVEIESDVVRYNVQINAHTVKKNLWKLNAKWWINSSKKVWHQSKKVSQRIWLTL